MEGDFFIGASIGTTLAKLVLRYVSLTDNVVNQNKFCAEVMLIIVSILHLGKSGTIYIRHNLFFIFSELNIFTY